jgi:hypothetical protein
MMVTSSRSSQVLQRMRARRLHDVLQIGRFLQFPALQGETHADSADDILGGV